MPDVIDGTLERCHAPDAQGPPSPEEAIYENPGPFHDVSVHDYNPHIADYSRHPPHPAQVRSLGRRHSDRRLDDAGDADDVYSAAHLHSEEPQESNYSDSLKYYVLERKQ